MSVSIEKGTTVYVYDEEYEIRNVVDFDTVQVARKKDGKIFEFKIGDIAFSPPERMRDRFQDLSEIPEAEIEKAKSRLEAIMPVLDGASRRDKERRAEEVGVSVTTLYNWIRDYETGGRQLSALVYMPNRGGKGEPRLAEEVEEIIRSTMEKLFKGPVKPTAKKVWEEVGIRCRNAGLKIPSVATVRRRVALFREDKFGRKKGKRGKREPVRGKYPDGLFPYHIIQIDHTFVDVMLVDDVYRTPLGRPWITLAIDVYSRMVAGYYISFESPGYFGVGQAIISLALPKDALVEKYDLSTKWPTFGLPQFVHADNAREFRGDDLKRVSDEYGIGLIWRPVKNPKYGGHIERLVGTLNTAIHSIEGTTMSNIKERGESDPRKDAVLTLGEFEEWLLVQIVDIYHNSVHSALGMTPLEKFREGIFGGPDTPPKGLPPVVEDVRRFRINFLPSLKRTVQHYGIKIDNIAYHSEALEPWIDATEPGSRPKRKRMFSIRRDPRDISFIYFYDPEIGDFIEIPYSDASHPPTSLWEYRAAMKDLKRMENRIYSEDEIFEHLQRQREIIENAKKRTGRQKKTVQRVAELVKTRTRSDGDDADSTPHIVPEAKDVSPFELDKIEPFDVADEREVDQEETPPVSGGKTVRVDAGNGDDDGFPF